MRNFLVLVFIIVGFSCKKQLHKNDTLSAGVQKCGILLTTPALDSFVYPTYYITANVAFSDGDQIVHFHGNVTGDHDGSWFLPRYSKDSSICTNP